MKCFLKYRFVLGSTILCRYLNIKIVVARGKSMPRSYRDNTIARCVLRSKKSKWVSIFIHITCIWVNGNIHHMALANMHVLQEGIIQRRTVASRNTGQLKRWCQSAGLYPRCGRHNQAALPGIANTYIPQIVGSSRRVGSKIILTREGDYHPTTEQE